MNHLNQPSSSRGYSLVSGKMMIFQRHWGKPPDVSQWQCLKKGHLFLQGRFAAFKARFPHRTLKFKAMPMENPLPK